MTPCRSEGALRAWLDRELPPAEMEQMAAHINECGACRGLRGELETRAAHVGALIQSLDAITANALILNSGKPRVARPEPAHRWVPVAVALAAGLALAFYLSPKRQAVPTASIAPPAFATAASAPVPTAAPTLTSAGLTAAAPRRPRRSVAKPAEFTALDDEPFESGVILRVDVPDTNIQADVVFSPDGRARAYRLIQASNRNSNKERSNE